MQREIIVETGIGDIRGTVAGPVSRFFGIPYAAPPTGERRWRPPEAVQPWSNVLDANAFGNDAMQRARPPGSRASMMSEDCLTLNIWGNVDAGQDRPVMVWFYGGSFVSGAASDTVTDGAVFAEAGVVFVSVSSRVGIFGWLAHSGLVAESPHQAAGNYGLLDQIAALRWIRGNIAAFGGDSRRITVFGVSSGAASIAFLITSPLAAGLFDRAILQSPGSFRPLSGLTAAAAAGDTLGTLEKLRDLPENQVLALETKLVPAVRRLTSAAILRPIRDGWVLPLDDRTAFEGGTFHDMPVIIGSNADEGGWLTETWAIEDLAAWRGVLSDNFGRAASSAGEAYPVSQDRDVRRALADVFGDTQFHLGAREVARAVAKRNRAYRYVFTRRRGGSGSRPHHGGELPYVFGHLRMWPEHHVDTPVDNRDRMLSAAIQNAWITFASDGFPGEIDGIRWPEARLGHVTLGETTQIDGEWRERQLDFVNAHARAKLNLPTV